MMLREGWLVLPPPDVLAFQEDGDLVLAWERRRGELVIHVSVSSLDQTWTWEGEEIHRSGFGWSLRETLQDYFREMD